MKRLLTTLLLTGTLLGLTACAAQTAPVTTKSSQSTVSKAFTTFKKTISAADTLATKDHQGRTYLPTQCSNGQVSLSDTAAVYVTKTFDLPGYLKKLQTTLDKQGYQTSLGTNDGHKIALISKDGYSYTAIALTTVNQAKINSNQAVLFTAASPCFTKN